MAAYRLSAHMPGVPVRTFENAQVFRAWRRTIWHSNKTVGFVPTMGALHEGHLQLVDASLQANDYTVVSIFVNPAQFAPHEDLSTYPRTLHHDLEQLGQREAAANVSGSLVVLVPQVSDMYPHGITQNVDEQVGAFIEMAGLSQYMEGTTRPTFFRGVATIVTKLFNLVLVRCFLTHTCPAGPCLFRPKRYSAGYNYPPYGRRSPLYVPYGRGACAYCAYGA